MIYMMLVGNQFTLVSLRGFQILHVIETMVKFSWKSEFQGKDCFEELG